MADKDNADSKTDAQGKNAETIHCTFCPSKMLNQGVGQFINIDFPLPHILRKRDEETNEKEEISDYWLVDEIHNFENIGVSHKVENIRYLACADCEKGPVGWQDLSTSRSYIALSRVKHEKSSSSTVQ